MTRFSRPRWAYWRSITSYLAGLAKLDDRLMIILDIDKLFEAEELATPSASPPMVSA